MNKICQTSIKPFKHIESPQSARIQEQKFTRNSPDKKLTLDSKNGILHPTQTIKWKVHVKQLYSKAVRSPKETCWYAQKVQPRRAGRRISIFLLVFQPVGTTLAGGFTLLVHRCGVRKRHRRWHGDCHDHRCGSAWLCVPSRHDEPLRRSLGPRCGLNRRAPHRQRLRAEGAGPRRCCVESRRLQTWLRAWLSAQLRCARLCTWFSAGLRTRLCTRL